MTYPVVKGKVFVFGSNQQGIHKRGAALDALQHYGAVLGVGEGRQGSSYALPTKATPYISRTLEGVQESVTMFLRYAELHPDDQFFVTRVGCGLAGFTDAQMAPMFRGAPSNCEFSPEWEVYL